MLVILPMFPVSGAEQLTAWGAIYPPRPNTSAIIAYCIPQLEVMAAECMLTSYLKVCEWNSVLRVMGLAKEEVPQSQLFSFDFELFDDRNHSLPSLYRVSG